MTAALDHFVRVLRGFARRLRDGAARADTRGGKLDFRATYTAHVDALKRSQPDHATAMELAIGGEFQAFGVLERSLLLQYGLPDDGYLIDVGCGSGRLSVQLGKAWRGRYLGIDVVQELLDHAARITGRPDWRFMLAPGLRIPEADGCADRVCFFSVLTHLLHEESYAYLQEAVRVLRPGGKVIFSFLEFHIPSQWAVFEQNVAQLDRRQHLNQFMSRDAIQAFARHLGVRVEAIHDGDKPFVRLDAPLTMSDGRVVEGLGVFGQSVCVLAKPA